MSNLMLLDDADDLLTIVEDDGPNANASPAAAGWRVLIVDDDPDIHEATAFALREAAIFDRPVELIHVHSAKEALARAEEFTDVAVALIDVVMETSDAGLRLVADLRERGLKQMRIVLRTGQPGYAPELSVIAAYEIDDYRTKAELTRTRLITVLTSCIRAYVQIGSIMRSRAGLEMIVDSSAKLFRRTNLELFAWGVLTQIAGLLRVKPTGVVCVSRGEVEADANVRIVCAAGDYEECVGHPVMDVLSPSAIQALEAARFNKGPVVRDGFAALSICQEGQALVALIELDGDLSNADFGLLKLFSTNITIGFENLSLIERLDRLAFLDPVLEAPNLNAFAAALEERLSADEVGGRIALISIDAFASICADHGQAIAHSYLKRIYAALTADSAAPLVARIGDDCFAVLGDDVTVSAKRIRPAFETSYEINGIDIATEASAVILELDDSATVADGMMQTARAALLNVKQTRRGECVLYDAEMKAAVRRRKSLRAALKCAVGRGGENMEIYLQPKCGLADGAMHGAEALLRWRHDDSFVSPGEFIPIAESAGLTPDLTEFVIHAVGDYARKAVKPTPVAVNLSLADMNLPDFARRVLDWSAKADLGPSLLEFEVTEGLGLQELPWVLGQVSLLKEAGYRIALDDFGTGYSSLGQFNRLPIDVLKIDRAFVTALDFQTARNSLAAIVIAMTEAFEVECVAEGIETLEQKQALMFLGCKLGQGYHFAKPMPVDDFLAYSAA